MDSLSIHLFKASFRPFVELLNEQGLKYTMREQRSGISASASGFIEILQSAAMWGSLASVIIAFLKARHSRRVLITTKDGQTLSAEGLTHKELEWVIAHAKTMTAIETKSEISEP